MNLDLFIRHRRGEPLSEQDYLAAKNEILAELESIVEFADVEGDTPEIRREKARTSKSYFARTYFPHYYTTQKPKHEEIIFDALAVENVPVVLTAFRGAGKSTDAMIDEAHDLLFPGGKKFQVHMMDSHDKAELYTQRILVELQHNRRILHDFGLMVQPDAARGNFETFGPDGKRVSRLYAMGMKMSIRGLVSGHTRPDKVICEDLQNSDSAVNEKLTKKLINKLLADIRFCFDQVRNSWRFVVIGNIICHGSMIDRLLKEAERWKKVVIPAEFFDAAGVRHATWREVFPLEKLDEMRSDVEIGGDAVYRREMLCQAVELDGECKESWFRHHNHDLPGLDHKAMVMQIDPSFADHGDKKAMIVGPLYKLAKESEHFGNARDAQGKALDEGEYRVGVDVFCRRCSIDDLIKKMYEWDRKYKPAFIRCDGTASQKYFMKRELERYAALPGYYTLAVKFTEQKENKEAKIAAVLPIIENGYLLLPPRVSPDVEELVVEFTRLGNADINDDGPDVVAEWIKSLKKKSPGKKKRRSSFC